jgi:hypothetical protein
MKIQEIKQQLEFYADTLFQAGWELGWNSVIDEINATSDKEWNIGNKTTAEVLRKLVKRLDLDGEDHSDVA